MPWVSPKFECVVPPDDSSCGVFGRQSHLCETDDGAEVVSLVGVLRSGLAPDIAAMRDYEGRFAALAVPRFDDLGGTLLEQRIRLGAELSETLARLQIAIYEENEQDYVVSRDAAERLLEQSRQIYQRMLSFCVEAYGRSPWRPRATKQAAPRQEPAEPLSACWANRQVSDGTVPVYYAIAQDGHVSEVAVAGRFMPHTPEQRTRLAFLTGVNGTLPNITTLPSAVSDDDVLRCIADFYYRTRFEPIHAPMARFTVYLLEVVASP